MVRTFAIFLLAALSASCLQAQIVSNPVLTTFKPYASSGYVTPAAVAAPRIGARGPVGVPRYLPAAAAGRSSRPVMTYRVPVARYYAAPRRVVTYGTTVAPARVVYRVPVTGPPTAIITYYAPLGAARAGVRNPPTYYRPTYPAASGLNYGGATTPNTPAGCGCGGR